MKYEVHNIIIGKVNLICTVIYLLFILGYCWFCYVTDTNVNISITGTDILLILIVILILM